MKNGSSSPRTTAEKAELDALVALPDDQITARERNKRHHARRAWNQAQPSLGRPNALYALK